MFSPSGAVDQAKKIEVQLKQNDCLTHVVKLTSRNFLATTILRGDRTKEDIMEIALSGQVGWGRLGSG